MRRDAFEAMERYMLSCMEDSAHDAQHVYRVLYAALLISGEIPEADTELVIAAALLHDVGRREQFEDPARCHAQVGAEKAYAFLRGLGWEEARAQRVRRAISQHRYRGDNPPDTLEGQILFDADKLDVAGALGVARTLMYQGAVNTPLYRMNGAGGLETGGEGGSFFQEYRFKLEKLYGGFYTAAGRRLAQERRQAAEDFARSLEREVLDLSGAGRAAVAQALEDSLPKYMA